MGFILGPEWFYGLDAGFEAVVMLITLFIALFSFRLYFVARQRKFLYFTLAFLLLSASYLTRSLIDWVAYTHLTQRIPNVTAAISTVMPVPELYSLGFLAYIVLTFAGFMILLAIFMRILSFFKVAFLFIIVVLLGLLAQKTFLVFHLILLIMLMFIVMHLVMNHRKKRTFNSFLVLYSMFALLAAQAFFMLVYFRPFFYIVGHGLQLIGFLILLFSMFLVLIK